jgi:hypothetical protein
MNQCPSFLISKAEHVLIPCLLYIKVSNRIMWHITSQSTHHSILINISRFITSQYFSVHKAFPINISRFRTVTLYNDWQGWNEMRRKNFRKKFDEFQYNLCWVIIMCMFGLWAWRIISLSHHILKKYHDHKIPQHEIL